MVLKFLPPVTSIKNQYSGINAHLNSHLQEEGWEEFHTHHISDIHSQLNRQLLGTGYEAHLEKGLQIRRLDDLFYQPESDVLVVDTNPSRFFSGSTPLTGFAYKPLNLTAILAPPEGYEEYFKSVVISKENVPVAWIELLSPSNKKKGGHYSNYLNKRHLLLTTHAFSYVEIDYLHQTSPTLPGIKDYSQQETDAAPYRVSVIDTREEEGVAYTQEFGVDDPIPEIRIPLHGTDILLFELGKAYHTTYQRVLYGVIPQTRVDYRELPVHVQFYTEDDRKRIVKRMLTVIDAFQQGVTLETGSEPLPIDETRVQQLLAQWGLNETLSSVQQK